MIGIAKFHWTYMITGKNIQDKNPEMLLSKIFKMMVDIDVPDAPKNEKGEIDNAKLDAKAAAYADILKSTIAGGGEYEQCIAIAVFFVAYMVLLIHSSVLLFFALAIAAVAAVTVAVTFTVPKAEDALFKSSYHGLQHDELIHQIVETQIP